MLLMHVTKDGTCTHCGAGVIRCAEQTCQEFFHPKHTRHIYHLAKCKMRNSRRLNKLKLLLN